MFAAVPRMYLLLLYLINRFLRLHSMILKELTNYTNEDEIMKHVNVKAKSFSVGIYKHPQDNTIYRNV